MNFKLPTLEEAAELVSKVETAVATFRTASATFGDKAASVAAVAAALVADVAPDLSVAGFSVGKVLAIAGDLADEEPNLAAAYGAVKAAVSGGAAPTEEEWSTFDSAADAAHASFRDALARFRAEGGA